MGVRANHRRMIMALSTERIRTLDDIRAFLAGNEASDLCPPVCEAAYALMERRLVMQDRGT